MKARMPTFEEYLAGAMLSNAPAWITIATASYLYEIALISEEIAAILIVGAYSIGGMIGAYLVCKRAYRDKIKTGIEVGLAALILNIIFTALFLGAPPAIPPLAGLIIGGAVGGIIAERKSS
ncbi:MAG: TIGR04086 family membrane protein [archaeon GB-1867-005]|nr:TIGR04086 family membrane protein [Candidatus Culexmicrobium cathedralense]